MPSRRLGKSLGAGRLIKFSQSAVEVSLFRLQDNRDPFETASHIVFVDMGQKFVILEGLFK